MPGEEVKIGDCEIWVERFGAGAPLVVLHAEDGPDGARAFLDYLGKNFEVHVPRHVGWSKTRRPSRIRTVRDLALVSQEYVERLGEPVPVIGLSFGGWVAAEMAVNSPALVSRLVLVSPIGVKIGGREDRDFVDIYLLPEPERSAVYYASGREPALSASANEDFFLEKAAADEALTLFCWEPYMHDPGLKGRLRRISASTLIISGDHDGFVLNPDYYAEYAKLVEGARQDVIAGAGHRVEEEKPQELAKRITSFISH